MLDKLKALPLAAALACNGQTPDNEVPEPQSDLEYLYETVNANFGWGTIEACPAVKVAEHTADRIRFCLDNPDSIHITSTPLSSTNSLEVLTDTNWTDEGCKIFLERAEGESLKITASLLDEKKEFPYFDYSHKAISSHDGDFRISLYDERTRRTMTGEDKVSIELALDLTDLPSIRFTPLSTPEEEGHFVQIRTSLTDCDTTGFDRSFKDMRESAKRVFREAFRP